MECDLKYLSGGELSRVILAFTLALADMFNVPLILLDEVTSSLDQDMNSIIIESVKTHFTNKLVLLISHQSLTGIYDKIINI
jgi:ABC-type transport system involved in cytochrome bd biosynthesis fused ATPase/permease subunit